MTTIADKKNCCFMGGREEKLQKLTLSLLGPWALVDVWGHFFFSVIFSDFLGGNPKLQKPWPSTE